MKISFWFILPFVMFLLSFPVYKLIQNEGITFNRRWKRFGLALYISVRKHIADVIAVVLVLSTPLLVTAGIEFYNILHNGMVASNEFSTVTPGIENVYNIVMIVTHIPLLVYWAKSRRPFFMKTRNALLKFLMTFSILKRLFKQPKESVPTKDNTNHRLPPISKWEELSMELIDGENIYFRTNDKKQVRFHYSELGFTNKKIKKKTVARQEWKYLTYQFFLRFHDSNYDKMDDDTGSMFNEGNRSTVRKNLNDAFKEMFGIDVNPFQGTSDSSMKDTSLIKLKPRYSLDDELYQGANSYDDEIRVESSDFHDLDG